MKQWLMGLQFKLQLSLAQAEFYFRASESIWQHVAMAGTEEVENMLLLDVAPLSLGHLFANL